MIINDFYIGSVFFAILFACIIVYTILTKKIEFLFRPSIICTLLLYFIYLLPSIVFHQQIYRMTPGIDQASFILSLVLSGTLVGTIYTDKLFTKVLNRFEINRMFDFNINSLLIILLTLVLILVCGIYFYIVPFYKTGLYAIFCEPRLYVYFRENSLKLLDQKWLIYTYLIAFSCICPLLCALLTQEILSSNFKKKIFWGLFAIPLLCFITFFMLITGARVGVLNCVLATMGVLWINLDRLKMIMAVILVLAIGFTTPAIISMSWVTRTNDKVPLPICSEEAQVLSAKHQDFLNNENLIAVEEEPLSEIEKRDSKAGFVIFMEGVINRAFIVPAAISGFYIEEALISGSNWRYIWSANQSKLGYTNKIATKYGHRLYGASHKIISSATAPTAFVYFNFLYFGWFSVLISILAILIQDILFFLAKLIPNKISSPFISTSIYYSFLFIQTSYFTVYFTHGYLLLALLIIIVIALAKYYNSNGKIWNS